MVNEGAGKEMFMKVNRIRKEKIKGRSFYNRR